MITAIVLLILICAPCLLGAAAGLRFERTLPLVTMGMAAVLFLSGTAGSLASGFYIVLILSLCALAYSAVRASRLKKWRETLACFFTPSFFCFIAAAAVIAYAYCGKLAYKWDEMDHWMYVVKAMAHLDDFGTNSAAHDMYASYPPAMALLQYLAAKLDALLRPGQGFTEWLSYFTYHLFALSLLVPLFPSFGFKSAWKNAVFVILMEVLMATVFRQEIFTILIDPFVGLVTGAGFLSVIFSEKKDALYRVHMCLLCATLALSKDVGTAAGVAVAAAFLIDSLRLSDLKGGRRGLLRASSSLLPLVSALCAKGLWSLELHTSEAEIQFSEKIDHLYYAKIFFFGGGDPYRQQVADIYRNELLRGSFIEAHGIRLSIAVIFAASAAVIAVLFVILRRLGTGVRRMAAASASAVLYCGLYLFDVGAVYMYKFRDYEALSLASLWRYVGIALLPLIMICAALGVYVLEKAEKKLSARCADADCRVKRAAARHGLSGAAYALMIAAIIFLSLSSEAVMDVLSRRDAALSHELRAPYDVISDQIKRECAEGDRLYIIAQGRDNDYGRDGFFDNLVVRMTVYPVYIGETAHSLGRPEREGDGREDIPYEEWFGDILENYDYVAVYEADEQLADVYGDAFEDRADIASDSLYKVDREARKLVPVGNRASGR